MCNNYIIFIPFSTFNIFKKISDLTRIYSTLKRYIPLVI